MRQAADLTGQRFGRLVVIGQSGRRGSAITWECRCDCGGVNRNPTTRSLQVGRTTSCGCVARARIGALRRKHGMTATPEFASWSRLLRRCYSETNNRYARYGGRGIRVCDEWRGSFEAFLGDMGPRPSSAHSVERINNDGNYEPGNCRWATRLEQMQNTSQNVYIDANGARLTIAEWARRTGLKAATIESRLKYGFSPADAVNSPLYARRASL
jgi:hypothetical protein